MGTRHLTFGFTFYLKEDMLLNIPQLKNLLLSRVINLLLASPETRKLTPILSKMISRLDV